MFDFASKYNDGMNKSVPDQTYVVFFKLINQEIHLISLIMIIELNNITVLMPGSCILAIWQTLNFLLLYLFQINEREEMFFFLKTVFVRKSHYNNL